MSNWIQFGQKLPQIGDCIDVKFDDGEEFSHNPYGRITRVVNVKDLGPNHCVVTDKLGVESWSLNSDKFIGSVVKDSYYWRISG